MAASGRRARPCSSLNRASAPTTRAPSVSGLQQRNAWRSADERAIAPHPAAVMALEIRTSSGSRVHVGHHEALCGQKSVALCWQPWARRTSPFGALGKSNTASTPSITTCVPVPSAADELAKTRTTGSVRGRMGCPHTSCRPPAGGKFKCCLPQLDTYVHSVILTGKFGLL